MWPSQSSITLSSFRSLQEGANQIKGCSTHNVCVWWFEAVFRLLLEGQVVRKSNFPPNITDGCLTLLCRIVSSIKVAAPLWRSNFTLLNLKIRSALLVLKHTAALKLQWYNENIKDYEIKPTNYITAYIYCNISIHSIYVLNCFFFNSIKEVKYIFKANTSSIYKYYQNIRPLDESGDRQLRPNWCESDLSRARFGVDVCSHCGVDVTCRWCPLDVGRTDRWLSPQHRIYAQTHTKRNNHSN